MNNLEFIKADQPDPKVCLSLARHEPDLLRVYMCTYIYMSIYIYISTKSKARTISVDLSM